MTTSIVSDTHRFQWSAVFAGALVGAATGFFLVMLGTGVGLSLSAHPGRPFLALGAIWFFAAQAFGFAAGGHVTGRLIGPAVETYREEELRAGLHGLAMWALAVVAGLLMLALAAYGGASLQTRMGAEPAANAYYADMLFRTGRGDVAPQRADDKAVAERILAVDMVQPVSENAQELARLVVLDTELTRPQAMQRVADVETRMAQDTQAMRKAAAWTSLWGAFALLFGAVIAVAASITARWEDDKLSYSFARRH